MVWVSDDVKPTTSQSTGSDDTQAAILEQLKKLNESQKDTADKIAKAVSGLTAPPKKAPSKQQKGDLAILASSISTIAKSLLGVELAIAAGLTLGIVTIAQFTMPGQNAGTLVERALGTDFQAGIEDGDEIGGYPVTSGFGLRDAPATNLGVGSSNHRGIDLGTPEGVKLYMIGDRGGTVVCDNQPDGAGLYATITVPGVPYTFRAMHLRNCEDGTFRQGQVYAETGNTGNSSGAHLHWEQIAVDGGEHVQPQKGYLLATIIGNWNEVMNEVATARKGFGDVTDRLMETIIIQESGGDSTAVNSSTQAAGKFQILPENIQPWADECGIGEAVSFDRFLGDPDLQRRIAGCKLKQYWEAAKALGVDDMTACRRVASAWYSGNPDWYDSTAPQDGYPSIADYTQAVCSRF